MVCTRAGNFVRERAPQTLIVDAASPVAGLVLDGLASRLEVDFTPTTHVYTGHWLWWFDRETSIRFFEVALGTAPGIADAYDWLNVGTDTSVHLSLVGGAELVHGQRYYLTVRATDDAGHSTVASSDGVLVDTTPSLPVGVQHGLQSGSATLYSRSTSSVELRWGDITDPEVSWWFSQKCCGVGVAFSLERSVEQSGVTGFEFGLSSTPVGNALGLPDILPLVPVGLAKQAVATGVELTHGTVYYGAVRSQVRV